ncbi:alpha/beta fold hydrolase [Pseudoroseomonas wenyumeiae]|uniref:Alpha/beta fold hydrolase n=1 Tax=Teichococcus wenyumeiae TaxID=2478470 RepID=A0A3A9JCP2_9PROT|nr:alpha/beta hydrolase [Pseudoroseomonas wenyumeiae]RKK02345.1 alpha/beta hydrolase [Pseudoroseomonas wenyumeiae]RMI20689.1 alpha/beta fold hydrolase [Pseudoroseomonas wenyumeiae]
MVIARNNVRILGHGRQSVVFAHGYGCDQEVWQLLTPAFLADYRVVLFDHVGSGGSDLSAYNPERYSSLHAYAEDVLDVCEASCGDAPIFIGHSVGAIIGALAAARQPGYFARLVMLTPSPCYLNDGDYPGGFSRQDIEDLLGLLDRNRLSWARLMAETIMGNPDRPDLAEDLAERFCRTDPVVARQFARVTFLSDHRAVLPAVSTETLVLQCAHDAIAPDAVGAYVQAHLPRGHLVRLKASGHCPHLSAPLETAAAIRSWLADNHFSRARA